MVLAGGNFGGYSQEQLAHADAMAAQQGITLYYDAGQGTIGAVRTNVASPHGIAAPVDLLRRAGISGRAVQAGERYEVYASGEPSVRTSLSESEITIQPSEVGAFVSGGAAGVQAARAAQVQQVQVEPVQGRPTPEEFVQAARHPPAPFGKFKAPSKQVSSVQVVQQPQRRLTAQEFVQAAKTPPAPFRDFVPPRIETGFAPKTPQWEKELWAEQALGKKGFYETRQREKEGAELISKITLFKEKYPEKEVPLEVYEKEYLPLQKEQAAFEKKYVTELLAGNILGEKEFTVTPKLVERAKVPLQGIDVKKSFTMQEMGYGQYETPSGFTFYRSPAPEEFQKTVMLGTLIGGVTAFGAGAAFSAGSWFGLAKFGAELGAFTVVQELSYEPSKEALKFIAPGREEWRYEIGATALSLTAGYLGARQMGRGVEKLKPSVERLLFGKQPLIYETTVDVGIIGEWTEKEALMTMKGTQRAVLSPEIKHAKLAKRWFAPQLKKEVPVDLIFEETGTKPYLRLSEIQPSAISIQEMRLPKVESGQFVSFKPKPQAAFAEAKFLYPEAEAIGLKVRIPTTAAPIEAGKWYDPMINQWYYEQQVVGKSFGGKPTEFFQIAYPKETGIRYGYLRQQLKEGFIELGEAKYGTKIKGYFFEPFQPKKGFFGDIYEKSFEKELKIIRAGQPIKKVGYAGKVKLDIQSLQGLPVEQKFGVKAIAMGTIEPSKFMVGGKPVVMKGTVGYIQKMKPTVVGKVFKPAQITKTPLSKTFGKEMLKADVAREMQKISSELRGNLQSIQIESEKFKDILVERIGRRITPVPLSKTRFDIPESYIGLSIKLPKSPSIEKAVIIQSQFEAGQGAALPKSFKFVEQSFVPSEKLKLYAETKYNLGYYVTGRTIPSIKQKDIIGEKLREDIGVKAREKIGIGERVDLGEKLKIGEKTGLGEKLGISEKIGVGEKIGIASRLRIGEKIGEKQKMKMGEKITSIGIAPIPPPPIPPPPIIFFALPKFYGKKAFPVKSFAEGFEVFVKKGGKFQKVSKTPLTKLSALGLGSKLTETAARTFFIKPTKKAGIRIPQFEKAWRPERFRSPFGKTRLPAGAFVEKSKFAIDVPQELKEITYKGIAARRQRKMLISPFWDYKKKTNKTKRRK